MGWGKVLLDEAVLERELPLADGTYAGAANHCDLAVAQGQEMVDRLTHSHHVVAIHIAGVFDRNVPVERYEGHVESLERHDGAGVPLIRHRQDHPIDSTLGEEADVPRVELGIPL